MENYGPCLYESHSHTPLCKHAVGLPEEYAEAAEQAGLKGLIVTCHNPMPNGFSEAARMDPDKFPDYLDMVDRARRAFTGRVDVRLGLEADYFPGYEEWLERQMRSAVFHYVLGSVHPHIPEYRARFRTDDPFEFQQTYFDHLVDAAQTGLFDCLAHPDLVKNSTPEDWDVERIMPVVCRALDRIARTGIAMELNTSGRNKVIPEMNPFPAMLIEMNRRGIPVVVGADAHQPERVAEGYLDALDLLESCGYKEIHYFLERTPQPLSITRARHSLSAQSDPPDQAVKQYAP